jgi:tetratricopeptide (TPR) repeat protein
MAVRNNLGYAHMKAGRWREAEEQLRRAIASGLTVQAPYLNFAILETARCADSRFCPGDGLRHVETAIRIGPADGKLFWEAAILYARVAQKEPEHLQTALSYAGKALENGISRQQLAKDWLLAALQKQKAFLDLPDPFPNGRGPVVQRTHVLDPFVGFDD